MTAWFALWAATVSWLFAHRHFVSPEPRLQWACVALAVAFGVPAFGDVARRARFSPRALGLLLPLGVALWLAEPAYRPSLWVLVVGVLGGVCCLRTGGAPRLLGAAAGSCLVVGAVLTVQAPAFGWATAWTARHEQVPHLAEALHGLMRWVGFDVSLGDDTLFVRTMRDVHAFPFTWSHLAPVALLSLGLGGLVVLWWRRGQRSLLTGVLSLTGLLAAYSVLRLFLLLLVFATTMLYVDYEADTVHVEVFWLPWIAAVSFLPLIPALARFVRLTPVGSAAVVAEHDADPGPEFPRRAGARLLVALLLGLGSVSIVLGNHYWEPGVAKQGRVLLDEAHSRWERSDKAYDTEWYGNESGYNYYCMAEYVGHHYELDRNLDAELTPELLAGYDVLLLKTPTESYAPAELDAIEQFVRGGGGLFAFGEHTNVFGSSVYLNPVLRRFGMAVRYDSVFDIERRWEQLRTFAPHGRSAITAQVPFLLFAVSCSITSKSWDVRPVIRSGGLWSLPIEYAAGNFYPHVEDTTYARFGAFDQMVAAAADRGRVVLFGDSTIYSNFLAFQPGKPELLLGAVEWLNRENGTVDTRRVGLLVGAGAFALALFLWVLLTPNLAFLVGVVSMAAGLAWLTLFGCHVANTRDYPPPAPLRAVDEVVLDLDYGTVELPVFGFTQRHQDSYEVFYQWILRLGYFPRVSLPADAHPAGGLDFEAALAAHRPIVLAKPRRSFPAGTAKRLRAFLERGGSLLVLEDASTAESSAAELLAPFGLGFGDPARGRAVLESGTGNRICTLRAGRRVTGGTPLLRTDGDETLAAWSRVGLGQIVAAGLAGRFVNTAMGVSDRAIPDLEQRAVFELEFALLRGLVENDLAGEFTRLGTTYARDD